MDLLLPVVGRREPQARDLTMPVVRSLLGSGAIGQCEEHLVESGRTQGHVFQGDASMLEWPEHPGELLRASLHHHAHPPGRRIDLWEAMRGLVEQGTNVLLTTQYLDEADHLADQIVIIDHGRTIAQGAPAELKKRAGRKVIEVHVRAPEEVAEVASALHAIGDGDAQVDESTRRVSVVMEGGTEQLTRALRPLEQRGITLEDVALRPPRLDEVFFALTDGTRSEKRVDDGHAPAAGLRVAPTDDDVKEENRHG